MKKTLFLLAVVFLISSNVIITSASASGGEVVSASVTVYNHGMGH